MTKLGDNINHIESLKMIVTAKVEVINQSPGKNHTYTALENPIEVHLSEAGKVWVGLTDRLKRGMYRCKVVFKLKWKGLGEEIVQIDKDELEQPLFVIAE